jgi:hypothetical protein
MIGPVFAGQPAAGEPTPSPPMIGPVRPIQPPPPMIGPVPPPGNIFQRMMGKRPLALAASGVGDMPEFAEHERMRVLKQKTAAPGATRRGPAKNRLCTEPNVPVSQRVREFPGESLTEQASKLFCAVCKAVLSKIKTTVKKHRGLSIATVITRATSGFRRNCSLFERELPSNIGISQGGIACFGEGYGPWASCDASTRCICVSRGFLKSLPFSALADQPP